jgi:hypothetical protein
MELYILVFDLQYETDYDGRFGYCKDHTAICLSPTKELYVESLYMPHKDLHSIVHFLFPFFIIMFLVGQWILLKTYNGSH